MSARPDKQIEERGMKLNTVERWVGGRKTVLLIMNDVKNGS